MRKGEIENKRRGVGVQRHQQGERRRGRDTPSGKERGIERDRERH